MAAAAAAAVGSREVASSVVCVGIIDQSPLVALQRVEDKSAQQWLVPYLCVVGTGTVRHLLQSFKVKCYKFAAACIKVTKVAFKAEDGMETDETDLKREMFWYVASRNLVAAYRDSVLGLSGILSCPLLPQIMIDSQFNPNGYVSPTAQGTQLGQLQEAAAWFFTMTFAASQLEIKNRQYFGWQKHYRFLAAYNKALSRHKIGAFAKERGWNDGLDPANDLGPCIIPNNGVDGRIIGAARIWKSNAWNNFGLTDDANWAYTARRKADVGRPLGEYHGRPKTLEVGVTEMRPCLQATADNHYRTTVCIDFATDGLDGTVLTRDDGGTRQKAAETQRNDLKPPQFQAGVMPPPHVKNPAAHGPASGPAAVQMASVFGTLSHEAALTEMLGAAYPHIDGDAAEATARAKSEEAAEQIKDARSYLLEFPLLCDRVGSVLATYLLRGAAKLAAHQFGTSQVCVRGAAPGLVSVDLQSALPYVYPFPAAVPDALFSVQSLDPAHGGQPRTVIGEFKTKWGGGPDGFRWAVGDGKAYKRQALFEAVAHWATCGSMNEATFGPHEAWAVVAKTPRRPTVDSAVAYSACCRMEEPKQLFRQVARLYEAIFNPGTNYAVDDASMTNVQNFKSALDRPSYMDPERWYNMDDEPFSSNEITVRGKYIAALWLHHDPPLGKALTTRRRGGILHVSRSVSSFEYRAGNFSIELFMDDENIFPELRGAGIEFAIGFKTTAPLLQLCIDAAICSCKSTDALWCSQVADILLNLEDRLESELIKVAGQIELLLTNVYDQSDVPARSAKERNELKEIVQSSTRPSRRLQRLMQTGAHDFVIDAAGSLKLVRSGKERSDYRVISVLQQSGTSRYVLLPCTERPTRLCYVYSKSAKEWRPRLFVPDAVGPRKKTKGMRGTDFRQADYATRWEWSEKEKMWIAPAAKKYDSTGQLIAGTNGAMHEPIITKNTVEPNDGAWTTWPVFGMGEDNAGNDATLARINADVEEALTYPVVRSKNDAIEP